MVNIINVEINWEDDPKIDAQKRPYLICPRCKYKIIRRIFEVAERSFHKCPECEQQMYVGGIKDDRDNR